MKVSYMKSNDNADVLANEIGEFYLYLSPDNNVVS
jgi:regulatory protein YycI of two-component signal transduction system YycFG